MTLGIRAALTGNLEKIMAEEANKTAAAVWVSVRSGAKALQGDLRAQTTSAGLGRGLTKSWRLKVYENERINAAGLVFSKSPRIIAAHIKGATIQARRGKWLAIPLPAAGKRSAETRGGFKAKRRARPTDFRGINKLRFVPIKGGRQALLVLDAVVGAKGTRARARAGLKLRANQSELTIPMFLLVLQTRLRPRLDLARAVRKAGERLPEAIADALAKADSANRDGR